MTPLFWLGVLALGGLGAVGRFAVDAIISQRAGRAFPIGTLMINVSGAFVLGLLAGAGAGGDLSVLAGTATIGSYTTFSTWMLESHRMVEDGEWRSAAVNLGASLVLGLLAAAAGRAIGMAL